jgi:hypothetical protein
MRRTVSRAFAAIVELLRVRLRIMIAWPQGLGKNWARILKNFDRWLAAIGPVAPPPLRLLRSEYSVGQSTLIATVPLP